MNIRAMIFGDDQRGADSLLPAKQPKGAHAGKLRSIPVPRAEARSSDMRQEDRHWQPGASVRLVHDGRTYDAKLINLSGGGAMVEAVGFRPLLRARVELHLDGGEAVECTTLWVKEDRVGLEFGSTPRS